MNTMKTSILLLGLIWGTLAVSIGQTTDTSQVTASTNSPAVEQPSAPPVVADQPPTTEPAVAEKPSETVTTDTVTAAEAPAGDDELRLNFRGAPLEMVLDYLSKAAGFTIVLETDVKGKVDVWNNRPLTRDEAVAVLDSALNRNGYAAVRNGRTLTIMSRDEAKKRNIPVMPGSNPEAIPKTDEMVTQIIPVRYANVSQLVKDLEPLKPAYATLTANDSANALVLTDTRANVRRMVEIVNALDTSVSSVSTVRVFPLKYADAKDLAAAVKELFASPTTNQQQGNNPRQFFRGFGGGGGGQGGGQGGGADNAAAQRVVPHVSAVADDRSNSLVVSAPEEYIPTIEQLVREIDVSVTDVTELRVFHLANADPVETAALFSQLFPDDSRTADQNQAAVRFRGGFGGGFFNQGNAQNSQTPTSDRMKKKGQVIAVPDQRTSSVIISAAGDLMPQIAAMIEQLDGNSSRKQSVYVIPLENAEVTDVLPVLKDMFNKDTTSQRNNSSTQNGQNNALTSRTTRNNQGTTTSNMGRGTGVGGGGGGFGGN
jgi:type II secretory pathway component GspD/PulD (secretin)